MEGWCGDEEFTCFYNQLEPFLNYVGGITLILILILGV